MSAPRSLAVTGIGGWLHGAPDWTILRGMLRGERSLAADAPAKPAANGLPAAERRRAPDSVRLAAEVAAQACAMAQCDPATLPCVFASTFGEIAITDYVCATLAHAPLELSPTQFHNSVLNAPAGYWTIATGCTAASSAGPCTFAAGLLEATVLACAEATPVLLAYCDVPATGPLAEVIGTRIPFGTALVLVPGAGGRRIRVTLVARDAAARRPRLPAAVREMARANPTADQTLALLAALANAPGAHLVLPLSNGTSMDLEVSP